MGDIDDSRDPFERTDPKLQAFRLQVAQEQGSLVRKLKGVATAVGLLGAIVTPLGGFSLWLLKEAKAQGNDAGVKAETVRVELESHKQDSAQVHRQTREEIHEVQMDIRALYRTIQTGKPSARLETPPARIDGGSP